MNYKVSQIKHQDSNLLVIERKFIDNYLLIVLSLGMSIGIQAFSAFKFVDQFINNISIILIIVAFISFLLSGSQEIAIDKKLSEIKVEINRRVFAKVKTYQLSQISYISWRLKPYLPRRLSLNTYAYYLMFKDNQKVLLENSDSLNYLMKTKASSELQILTDFLKLEIKKEGFLL
jgi:hypothetical protein